MVRGKRILVCELKGNFFLFICILINVILLTLSSISSAYYFESTCKNTSNCNPTNHTNFICWNAICVCDKSLKLVYDHSKNYCLRPPGGKCKSDEDCVQNAHCDNKTQLCVCSAPNFEETSESECKAKYKCQCNDTVLCNEKKFLQCTNERCSCATGHNMYYDREKDKCVVELGQKCELTAWMDIQMECESNAQCIAKEEDKDKFYGHCICKENYFAHFDRCEMMVGSPCNETDESSCQDGLLLKCHRGQCQCMDDAIFDSKHNQCRRKIGSSCRPSLENQCVTNAKCTPSSEKIAKGEATCECEDGYAETSRGSCKAAYANYCQDDNDCFREEGTLLRCSKGFCRCQLGQEYEEQSKSCVSLIGEPCNSHLTHRNVQKMHCVQNALCIPDEKDLGRCECKHPFVQLNTSCVPGVGAPCKNLSDCSPQRALACSGEICICKNTTIFDPLSKNCRIKSGDYCQQNGELECVRNSTCTTYDLDTGLESKCFCDKEFDAVPDGRCLLGYGKPCHQFSFICNEYRAFRCINSVCTCESPLIFNDKHNYCEIVQVSSHKRLSNQANQTYYASTALISSILCLLICIYNLQIKLN